VARHRWPFAGVFGAPSTAEARLQLAVDLTADVAIGERTALVDAFLAAGQRDLGLHAAVLEVQAQGDQRQALLRYARGELLDLVLVRQQLAVARGLVVGAVALLVRLDRRTHEPQLAPALLRVGLAQRDLAGTQGLDLRPCQRDAGLEALEDVVLVPRLAVARDRAF